MMGRVLLCPHHHGARCSLASFLPRQLAFLALLLLLLLPEEVEAAPPTALILLPVVFPAPLHLPLLLVVVRRHVHEAAVRRG